MWKEWRLLRLNHGAVICRITCVCYMVSRVEFKTSWQARSMRNDLFQHASEGDSSRRHIKARLVSKNCSFNFLPHIPI